MAPPNPGLWGETSRKYSYYMPEAAILVAGDVEGDDAAALLHLPLGQFILRVAFEAGVDGARHLRMGFEEAGKRPGGAALPFDPQSSVSSPFNRSQALNGLERRAGVAIKRPRSP